MLGDTNLAPKTSRTVLYRGAKFDFEEVTVERPGSPPLRRQVVRHPGAVVIVPLLAGPGGTGIVLIRNWRVSLETWLFELPAGTLERGEDPALCARRELREETGYEAATLRPLGRFHTSPGLSDEVMWAFLALGLTPGPQRLEADEQISVHPTPWGRALGMIPNGELTDAKSMLALMLAEKLLGPGGESLGLSPH